MAAPARQISIPQELALRKPRSLWTDAWDQFRHHQLAMGGVAVLAIILLATLIGPLLWTEPKDVINFGESLTGPSLEHPFGTDDLGHDILARVFFGGRISLAVGLSAVIVAVLLGTLVGAAAGFFGRLDNPLMRLTDVFLSLPILPLLLVVIFLFRDTLRDIFGPEIGIFILIVAVIGVLNWMPVARLVRAQFLSLKQKEFVEAARTIGASNGRIIMRHMLPNVLNVVVVTATIGVGGAILTESTLSFLGLGFPSDVPTWGRLLYDAEQYVDIAPYWAIFPGLFVFLTVLSINYIGDGLRDALDPRKTA